MKQKTLSILLAHLSGRDGGAERQTAALAAGLVGNGHRVLLLVHRSAPVERRALEAGAPIFSLQPNFPSAPGGFFTYWCRERIRRSGDWGRTMSENKLNRNALRGPRALALAQGMVVGCGASTVGTTVTRPA